ncbi:MAG: IPT/TIG domain-containing protein [Chloroflexota bacterium]
MLGAHRSHPARTGRLAAAVIALLLMASVAPGAAAKPLSPAPSITSISPASGARGTTVTLTGRDFGGPQARITVGGVIAPLISGVGNRAVFRVPAAAPFGQTLVRVSNPSGQSDAVPFTVIGFGGTMTLLPATSGAVTQTVGRAGGTLVSGGLRLAIPAGALSSDVAITMRPLLGVSGTPLDNSYIGGVQLEPEGLAFLVPAVLTIPLPAGVRPADVLAFGSTGAGTDVHLQPYLLAGDQITLTVWHFSSESAAAGGTAGASAMAAAPLSSAESAAMQAIALADAACAQESSSGIIGGPACANQGVAHVAALLDWAITVRPGLQEAIGAPYFTAEAALAEWLRWWGRIQLSGVEDQMVSSVSGARAAAVAVLADQARRRLGNCTGTSLVEQFRDVQRLADIALQGAITEPLAGEPSPLPSAADGSIMDACAHVTVDELALPDPAARGTDRNTLKGRASLDVWSGPNRTDLPITLNIEVDGGGTTTSPSPDADGRFEAPLFVFAETSTLRVKVTATATSEVLHEVGVDQGSANLTRAATDRLDLSPGDTTLQPGGQVDIAARLAGDDVANRTVGFAVTGAGSLSATSGSTDSAGATSVTFTAGSAFGTTVLTASFVDGTVTRTKAITITVDDDAAVAITPETAIVETGSQASFSATVTGAANLAVTWSATCGTVTSAGLYTAPSAEASCIVTATSVEDGASATATVTVVEGEPEDPPAGIAVSISPDDVMLARGASQQFAATVTGTANTSVTWTAQCGNTSMPIGSTGLFSVPSDLTAANARCWVTAASVADPSVDASAIVRVGWVEVVSVYADICADAYDSYHATEADPGACLTSVGGTQTATQGGAAASASTDASVDLTAGQLVVAGSISGTGSAEPAQVFDQDGNEILRECFAQAQGSIYLTFRVVGERVPWALDFGGQVSLNGNRTAHAIAFARFSPTLGGGSIVGTGTGEDHGYPGGIQPYTQQTIGGDSGSDAPDVAFADHGWLLDGVYILEFYGAATIDEVTGGGGSATTLATFGFVVGPYVD